MFDLDRFKADCCSAGSRTDALGAIQEVVGRAVATPGSVNGINSQFWERRHRLRRPSYAALKAFLMSDQRP